MRSMRRFPKLDQMLAFERLRPGFPSRPEVVEIRYEPIVDSLGDEELMVTVILGDDTTDEELSSGHLKPIRETIHQALKDDERFPYIRFVTVEESDDSEE